MNVCFSGYTSVGKTTHSQLLAETLGLSYVSASEILLDRLGVDRAEVNESQTWFHRYQEFGAILQSTSIDAELDELLRRRAHEDDGVVFDTRFLPWFSGDRVIRIWLESDLAARARKCFVSMDGDGPEVMDCAIKVQQRDTLDVERLMNGHRQIFAPNKDVFDAVLDNSALIPEPTRQCADVGIAVFHQYVLATVATLTGDRRRLDDLFAESPAVASSIVRHIRKAREG